ncbi:MAG TPA: hypothetical protein VIE17_08015 [Methylophilaceae bacterium]
MIFRLLLVLGFASLVACATDTPATSDSKQVPHLESRNTLNQLGKADLDRMADVEMQANSDSLRLLMIKLYKRNPHELKKSTSSSVDEMVTWVFNGPHGWQFKEINRKQGTEAIQLAFDPKYKGDRVLPFIVGLQTMLVKAHGGKVDFYMTDSIEPQNVYNAARNVEIAAWKLSTARDASGNLYLLTNEINDTDRNLSFEREFGKIIGRLDLYAVTLEEKSQRFITRVTHSLATAIFFPL